MTSAADQFCVLGGSGGADRDRMRLRFDRGPPDGSRDFFRFGSCDVCAFSLASVFHRDLLNRFGHLDGILF
jgi:hypothetical protein